MNDDLKRYYLPVLREKAAGNVLDFGSGHGRVLAALMKAGFSHVWGFERNERLKAVLPAEIRDVTTFGGDGTLFLRQQGKRWDAVILKDVLYYFNDDEAVSFLGELRAHLATGALLLVEVFNGATWTGPFVMYKDRGIKRVLTEHSLASLLEESGYRVEQMTGIRPGVSGVRSLLFYLSSRFWKLWLRMFYWLERGIDSQNPSILEKKIFAVARVREPANG